MTPLEMEQAVYSGVKRARNVRLVRVCGHVPQLKAGCPPDLDAHSHIYPARDGAVVRFGPARAGEHFRSLMTRMIAVASAPHARGTQCCGSGDL